MATLYVTEYGTISGLPATANGQMPLEPPLADYIVSIPGISPAFQPTTRMVRLNCDVVCSVLFGQAPSASTSNGRMAQNQTEFRGVPEGMAFRVSVVANV
jgi:hypothetical protein